MNTEKAIAQDGKLSRREMLKGVVVFMGAAALGAAITPGTALAGGMSKASAKYQDHPNGKAHCSNCTFFTAGASPTAMGTCAVVSGNVSPDGWCMLYAAKGA